MYRRELSLKQKSPARTGICHYRVEIEGSKSVDAERASKSDVESEVDMDGAVSASGHRYALVVDDSNTGRRIMNALLTVLGYTVIMAEDPCEALKAVRLRQFQLITVDRILGDDDGVDLVKSLRSHSSCGEAVCILAVTGHSGKEHREAFFSAGADGFLTKPFTVSDLANTLQALGQPEIA